MTSSCSHINFERLILSRNGNNENKLISAPFIYNLVIKLHSDESKQVFRILLSDVNICICVMYIH